MNYSEQILNELVKIANANRCGLFEAASDYCEEHDLDHEEFIASLDKNVINRLKLDAVNERKVRRCIMAPVAKLF